MQLKQGMFEALARYEDKAGRSQTDDSIPVTRSLFIIFCNQPHGSSPETISWRGPRSGTRPAGRGQVSEASNGGRDGDCSAPWSTESEVER